MWEDFKTGIDYFTRWERIAVVTIRRAVRFFGFLMSATTRLFSGAAIAYARE